MSVVLRRAGGGPGVTAVTEGPGQFCYDLGWQVTETIRLTENTRARLMAGVATDTLFMGLQMLLTMYFLQQQAFKAIDPASELIQGHV